jgi:hypothetical protein
LVRITEILWTKEFLAVSSIYMTCLLSVGVAGGYTIFNQTRVTEKALQISQARSDAATRAQTAILVMGKAQAQLISAPDPEARRSASVLAIRALSDLDENIQHLQEALPGSPKVAELTTLLGKIGPAKMEVIKSVRANHLGAAREKVREMQAAMNRVEQLSEEVVQEQRDDSQPSGAR